jgi:hypothetical protein
MKAVIETACAEGFGATCITGRMGGVADGDPTQIDSIEKAKAHE